jgi:hypothetical protein
VSEDFRIPATCLFEGVREDGEAVVGAVLVNRARQRNRSTQLNDLERDGAKRIAENVVKQMPLSHALAFERDADSLLSGRSF